MSNRGYVLSAALPCVSFATVKRIWSDALGLNPGRTYLTFKKPQISKPEADG